MKKNWKRKEKKRKVNTCVYVHSILHHWACILISDGHFIENICWWKFVCEFSEIFFFFIFTSSHPLLKSEMSDLLLGALGHCPFCYYIHCWCDFTPCLIWVDHHSFLYVHCFTLILTIAFDSFPSLHPLILLLQWPIPSLLFSLHHFCTSHYHLSPHWYYIHIGHS